MKDELRKIYMETEPPEELPGVVEAALRRGERRARARKRAWRIAYPIAGVHTGAEYSTHLRLRNV